MTAPHRTAVPNTQLQDWLRRIGWRPETLAARINAAMANTDGDRRAMHVKTPYGWISRGETPRAPVAEIVVRLIADATRCPVDFEQVWPRRNADKWAPLPADHGLDVPWGLSGLLDLLGNWKPMVDRRTFVTISGLALTTPAWRLLDQPSAPLAAVTGNGDVVPEPAMRLVEEIVAGAQQMDDQHGASAATFVTDQFGCVSHLLRHASYNATTGRRLAASLAQLAQTAGWMAYESERDSQAQRWFLAGLRAAYVADDRGLAASIIALMSHQAIELGKTADAVQLGAASEEAASGSLAIVQALITARASLGHADAGNLSAFQRARESTLSLLEKAKRDADPAPRWASYVSRTELDAMAGRGMVVLARRVPARQSRLLVEAEALLHGRAYTDVADVPQRSALRHGAWLGMAFARSGDLDKAVAAGRRALTRLPNVASTRGGVRLLQQLRHELTPHASRSPAVKELVADLDAQLPMTRLRNP